MGIQDIPKYTEPEVEDTGELPPGEQDPIAWLISTGQFGKAEVPWPADQMNPVQVQASPTAPPPSPEVQELGQPMWPPPMDLMTALANLQKGQPQDDHNYGESSFNEQYNPPGPPGSPFSPGSPYFSGTQRPYLSSPIRSPAVAGPSGIGSSGQRSTPSSSQLPRPLSPSQRMSSPLVEQNRTSRVPPRARRALDFELGSPERSPLFQRRRSPRSPRPLTSSPQRVPSVHPLQQWHRTQQQQQIGGAFAQPGPPMPGPNQSFSDWLDAQGYQQTRLHPVQHWHQAQRQRQPGPHPLQHWLRSQQRPQQRHPLQHWHQSQGNNTRRL